MCLKYNENKSANIRETYINKMRVLSTFYILTI